MQFIRTQIPEVILIKPDVISDQRGFFLESYKKSTFLKNGICDNFVQDNHSQSSYGVLRGLHYQTAPMAQGKLVRVIEGEIFDVAVDIRQGSPTYGQWIGVELSAENGKQLYIPAGFAHGFMTLEPDTMIFYKVTGYYSPECDRGLAWNDSDILIDWPQQRVKPILSHKDEMQPSLKSFQSPFHYNGAPMNLTEVVL